MYNIRVFLWLTLLGMAWLTYTAWVADYGAAPPPPPNGQAPVAIDDGVPTGQLPSLTPSADPPPQAPPVAPATPSGELVRVRTDVLDVRIASQGGDLVRADLLQYPIDKDSPEPIVRLLDDSSAERWTFQTGLRSAVGGAEPNHLATFRTASNEYSLAPGQNELVVTLDWVGEGQISARKTYTFRRGQYAVDLTLTVVPTAGAAGAARRTCRWSAFMCLSIGRSFRSTRTRSRDR